MAMRRPILMLLAITAALCTSATMLYPASTITAASPSFTHVSAAVTAAAAGDTVIIPAGSATWSSTLSITKSLTLQGAGIGATMITSGGPTLIRISPSSPASNPAIRVTGLDLNGGGSVIELTNSSTTVALSNIRIDHNAIRNGTTNGVNITADVWALIDNNAFSNNNIDVRALGQSTTSWDNFPAAAGTATKPYIEDNTFTHTAPYSFIVEGGQGGRYVFRRNTVTETSGVSGFIELFDMHGNNGDWPGNRGTVESEVYNNTLNLAGINHRVANVRGGDAKYFNNTVTQSGGSASLEITEYDGWSYCNKTTYPGYDPVRDAFFFNNKRNGATQNPSVANPAPCSCSVCDDFFLQLNRDYFLPAAGLASARPATCTANTYFAATDSGVISKCVSTNTWAIHYAPYVYPHPLQNQAVNLPPSPPNTLRIVP